MKLVVRSLRRDLVLIIFFHTRYLFSWPLVSSAFERIPFLIPSIYSDWAFPPYQFEWRVADITAPLYNTDRGTTLQTLLEPYQTYFT